MAYEGSHSIKAGGDYMDGRTDVTSAWTGGSSLRLQNDYGEPYYLHRFYGESSTDSTPRPEGRIENAQVLDYSVWAQDTWSVASNLTVNVGLRWDGETTRNYLGQTILRFHDQWQPGLGVVWDPWQDGATKVFASAGRFSYALPAALAAETFGDYTIWAVYNFDPDSLVPGSRCHRVQAPNPSKGARPLVRPSTPECARRIRTRSSWESRGYWHPG